MKDVSERCLCGISFFQVIENLILTIRTAVLALKRPVVLISLMVLDFNATAKSANNSNADDPRNHIYQYAVEIGSRTAYLWIPPNCARVRGAIVSFANLLERKWLEDLSIRRTAGDIGLAIIWIGPAKKGDMTITADMKPEMIGKFLKMMEDFGAISGYRELSHTPIIPMGHSANGQFAWTFPNALPERTIAGIPVKTGPFPSKLNFSGIPICYIIGQTTEWPQFRVPDPATQPGDRDYYWPIVRDAALALRKSNPENLVSVVVDPGGGHFDWSVRLAKFIALYIRTACKYRLTETDTNLKAINNENGWLIGTGGVNPDLHPPAPYQKFGGGSNEGFWFFDRQTALAAVKFEGDRVDRQKQMVTFVSDGSPLPVAKLGYAPIKLKTNTYADTFRLKGTFLTEIPPELKGRGDHLGHAQSPITFNVITGPAVQIAENAFKIQFDRGNNTEIWLQEENSGDKNYRHAVQPGKITIPISLNEGKQQKIVFDKIPDLNRDIKSINLKAYADSGLPVTFYVKSGPAYITGQTLHVSDIPRKSKFPVKIDIVAYQFGRSATPLYQSAEPVEQTFYITQ